MSVTFELKNNPLTLLIEDKVIKKFHEGMSVQNIVKYLTNMLTKEDILKTNNSFFIRKLKSHCIIEKSEEPIIPFKSTIFKERKPSPSNIEVFTDGGCIGNGKEINVGAWAYIILDKGKKVFEDGEKCNNTTNNKMEMIASIKALNKLFSNDLLNRKITIYSDSEYLVNGYNIWTNNWRTNGWKTKAGDEVKNKELWVQLDYLKSKFRDLNFQWTKGHSLRDTKESKYNKEVDERCSFLMG